jgi:hypothetical protein
MTSRSPSRAGLAVLAGTLLVCAWFVEGGEVLLLVAGCFVGVLVVAPGRFAAYVAWLAAAVAVAFALGMARFEAVNCEGSGGECDLAALEGLWWAAAALALGAAVIVVLEVRRHLAQRAARASADATR